MDAAALLLNGLANATPIALAALGETVVERAGLVNLGIEGMMAVGAAFGVLGGLLTNNPGLGLALGGLMGLLLSLVYAFIVISLKGDQTVTGLILVFMGLGIAELLGAATEGLPSPPLRGFAGRLDLLQISTAALAVALWAYLYRTWSGLELRSLGEDVEAAYSLGARVTRIRVAAIMFGGFVAGVAGAYMPIGLQYGKWFSGITAGWGWIALGVVILGNWHPIGSFLASYLVGLLFAVRPILPSLGIPPALADMSPYLVVILALVAVSKLSEKLGLNPPRMVWRRE